MESGLTRAMLTNKSDIAQGVSFVSEHLKQFEISLASATDDDDLSGKHGRSFGKGLPGVEIEQLPAGRVSRSTVFSLASDTAVSTSTICAAAMAWGGMQINHRDKAFRQDYSDAWLDVAHRLRTGRLSRAAGYDEFRQLRADGQLSGMGPAYFTKLIYFLMPRQARSLPPGFIMDQWAGCSINVLTEATIVLMDTVAEWVGSGDALRKRFTFIVSDCNTGEHYERFCSTIDQLAKKFEKNTEQIDRALLSEGGRNPAAWRRYVMTQRKP